MIRQHKILLLTLVLGMMTFTSPLYADMLGVTNGSNGGPGELVSIDLATGAATLIGTLPETMTEAVYDVGNNQFYAQGSNGSFVLYEIDPTNGAQISSIATSGAYNGLEFVGATLYATVISGGGSPSDLATVDPATGAATIIGQTGYAAITGLAYNSATGTMYGVIGGGDAASGSLVTLNMATGVATIVGPTGFDKVGSIEFGVDGNLYGGLTSNDAAQPNSLILINTLTGAGTVVGNTTYSISGLAETIAPVFASPTPVPALSQWALITLAILMGLLFLFGLRRRV